jgi:hypothetical protein
MASIANSVTARFLVKLSPSTAAGSLSRGRYRWRRGHGPARCGETGPGRLVEWTGRRGPRDLRQRAVVRHDVP